MAQAFELHVVEQTSSAITIEGREDALEAFALNPAPPRASPA